MLLTEEEAKTKWCPFARRMPYAEAAEASEIDKIGINPDYVDEMRAMYPCIASACMAWRWVEELDKDAPGDEAVFKRERGYCGLAGSAS